MIDRNIDHLYHVYYCTVAVGPFVSMITQNRFLTPQYKTLKANYLPPTPFLTPCLSPSLDTLSLLLPLTVPLLVLLLPHPPPLPFLSPSSPTSPCSPLSTHPSFLSHLFIIFLPHYSTPIAPPPHSPTNFSFPPFFLYLLHLPLSQNKILIMELPSSFSLFPVYSEKAQDR